MIIMNITIFYLFRSLFSQKWTFVNFLVLVDCGNALAHILVIAQYFWSVGSVINVDYNIIYHKENYR